MSINVKMNDTTHSLVESDDLATETASVSKHNLSFSFTKVKNLVTLVISGVSTFSMNQNYTIGSSLIPDGYRPTDNIFLGVPMVSNNNIIGNARFRFDENGAISVTPSVGQMSEFYGSTSWITGGVILRELLKRLREGFVYVC